MKRLEIYNNITQQIKEKLKVGIIPWRKTWKSGIPQNYITKRPYRGINFLSLCLQDFPSPYYLTYLQCKDQNGQVNKGAEGNLVVYWDLRDFVDDEKPDSDKCVKKVPITRCSYVFNLSQTTLSPDIENPNIIACEDIIAGMKDQPQIKNNIRGCFYKPGEDYISIPTIDSFDSPEEYYSSMFHELVHWTGHPKRLNRFSSNFGDHLYSSEELVAELGSAYLCGLCGIALNVLENQAAYINSWLSLLSNDSNFLINAAVQAQRAVNYLLGVS